MALVPGAQQAASSSNTYCSSGCGYCCFRGEDTRVTFADHLYTAFDNASFRTFRDENDLERGEGIKPELEKAIQQSRSSVIVFSKNYASSKWCLNELVMILKLKKTSDHVVLPVFYDVDPSHVRNQTGSLAKAFARHQKTQSCDMVKEWREALTEVAGLTGMVLQNEADGHESKFIAKIVEVIEDKLRRTTSSVDPNLIGIHSRAKNINLWLQDRSNDVGILVIHGMRGIGKTTIAKFVYDSNFRRFQRSSFVENIREISEQSNGLIQIQKQLLHDISTGRKVKIHSIREGMTRIEDVISYKKVLVLDDVDHKDQLLDVVFGMRDRFYPGSKIIITTSSAGLLNTDHQVKFHCVETWNYVESMKLFSLHAFGQEYPLKCYMDHSRRLVQHCEGLPLALKILGSSLSGKDISVWESAVRKLEAIPDGQILKKLKLSYDSLQDNHDQDLFLHIACFFIGMDKDVIVSILDDSDFFTDIGMQNLIDRYLVRIDKYKKIQMHHMIRDMGREIVLLESKEPGQRSRLWRHKDSFEVLKENSGTQKIEGLCFMNMKMHPEYAPSRNSGDQLVFETNAFSRMHRLKFLQLSHVKLNGSYKEFPTGIRWLCWLQFPFDSLPCDFPLDSLVALEMCYSSLRQVLKRTAYLPSLKILNLSHSHGLKATPDFWPVPNLERLILKDCANLVDVHESIGDLERLICLNMEDCKNLKRLPKNISMLTSLETLIISGCSKVEVFPTEISKMESLKVFQADGVSIHQLRTASQWWTLWPTKSVGISWASYLPHNLVTLSLRNCNLSDENFPRDFGNLPSLQILDLSSNSICTLPDCVRGVRGLRKLSLEGCKRLKSLLRLPSVGELEIQDCKSLEIVTFQSLSDSRICAAMDSNFNLVEVEYWYKLEPIETVDVEMINLLGLSNLNLNEAITMEIISPFSEGRSMTHSLQGLYEYGIFNTFLPGDYEVPQYGSFTHKSRGSSISFTVPSLPTSRIRGFYVYAESYNNDSPDFNADNDVPHPVLMKVSNKSKVLKWIYGPTFFCVPGYGQDVIWLSHWKFGNKLEGGDEVTFSVFTTSGLQIKEWGLKLVYYEEDEMSTQHNTTEPFYPCVIAGDLSCNLVSGAYVLFPLMDISIDDMLTSAWFNCVTGDVDEITEKEEEQQGDCTLAAQMGSNDNRNSRGGRGWKVVMMIMATVFVLSFPLVSHSSLFQRKKQRATSPPRLNPGLQTISDHE
ncbi:TMV resistance protein N-like [Pyrus ussuriensis x Pyrus communis]|uniref:TMV resistance protein N-like n=1 Tax=Pyrus ussuriensis x Pyrus communis TaxID=2448454 RepID=A0A5N5FMR4_9ROSA|nr:TMV resistance protein N-like [Pyrus ussuriensis x Pyrus communis]